MTTAAPPVAALSRAERFRRIGLGLLRAAVVATAVVTAYYLLPLQRLTSVPLGVSLAIGLLVLTAVAAYQTRAIIRARHPNIKAVEALATTVPLFLVLFAASYYLTAQSDPASFSAEPVTRTDALYFTVTVFSTVGFGDITAKSQAARVMVSAQMILDLIFLGFGVRVFLGAVELGRQQPDSEAPETLPAEGGPEVAP